MAAPGQEDTVPEPLKYKIWILKVSIHCEGCKREVKRVLESIEGVYTATVDPQKQKVTVAGNIEAAILIKKLIKTGKHAELWPEPKPSNPDSNAQDDSGGGKKQKSKKNKNGDKPNGESLDKTETKEPEPESETKDEEEGEDPAAVESGKTDQKPAGKKKGKKNINGDGKNGITVNHKNGGGGGNTAAVQDNLKAATMPHQQGYSLPMYPLPQYMVSYNNMQPVMAGSYYIPAMAPVAATGSYDFFSEKNANACVVM